MESHELATSVDRLVAIKAELEKLSDEKSTIEAQLLKQCQVDLLDTKNKTVAYSGTTGKVIATMASSLKVIYPTLLEQIFGSASKDVITVKVDHKLSAPAQRMLTGLWKGDYFRSTIPELVDGLPCDDSAKATLKKKLKGASYDTDMTSLMKIGGLATEDAGQTAYLVAEAAIWQSFQQMLTVTGRTDAEDVSSILELIAGTVMVEETPKITVEPN